MGMEIKIDAVNMLKILVNAGLDATDAKAIIFDLLQYPDGDFPVRQQLKNLKKQRKKVIEVHEDEDEEDDDEVEDTEDVEEVENSTKDDPLATKIRSPKRINFRGFGGISQPLTPSSLPRKGSL